MFTGKSELEKAFKQLAERLRFAGAPHTAILVGGGAALNVLGFLNKTTKDVDIIAIRERRRPGFAIRASGATPWIS